MLGALESQTLTSWITRFERVQSEVRLNKKESVNYHLSIVIWGLGRLALRSGTSPAPNAIRTARAKGLQRPDDK